MRALGGIANGSGAPAPGGSKLCGARGARLLPAGALLLSASLWNPALAQSGGPYAIVSSTIASGGATFSTGGAETLGGTIGQADAGRVSGGTFVLNGGFWAPAAAGAPTVTPSTTETVHPTVSATPTPSSTLPPSATPTRTLATAPSPSASATPSPTASPTQTPTHSPTSTPRATPTASPTPTPAETPTPPCVGDCNNDSSVTVDELLTLVNIALGTAQPSACPHGVPVGAGVNVSLIIQAVNNALNGCGSS